MTTTIVALGLTVLAPIAILIAGHVLDKRACRFAEITHTEEA